jgi:PleD family two-component response regulator
VLTYKEGSEITAKLLDAGTVDIISSPVSPEIVSNRLRNILETFYVRRELESLKVLKIIFFSIINCLGHCRGK